MRHLLIVFILLGGIINPLFAQVTVGDETNYSEFESDGTLEFHGDATVWNDYVVPLASAISGKNVPPFIKFMDDGSGSDGVFAFAFEDQSNPGNEQSLSFTIQMPHNWKEGSTIYPHLHWSPGDNTNGAVVWGLEYTWIEYNSSTPQTFPATTVETITASFTSSDHMHLLHSFSAITPNSNQDNISSILVMRIFRNSSNAADTYNGDAFGLSFDIHYEMDTGGSRQEFIK